MAAILGPTFAAEVQAAGLAGLAFSWGDDGVVELHDTAGQLVRLTRSVAGTVIETRTPDPGLFARLDDTTIAALKAVLVAHKPTAPVPATTAQRNRVAVLAQADAVAADPAVSDVIKNFVAALKRML